MLNHVERYSVRTVVQLCMVALALFSGSLALQAQDGALKIAELGECKLESGQVISDCKIGYRTFGKLSESGDNAVLMPSWLYGLSGDLVSLFGDGSSPQHLVDTTKFFGIAIDPLGNGVSSSPSNSAKQHGTAFPAYTLRDGVDAQYRVMTEVLHLKHLHAVTGLSMGGEQTFVWATLHPEFFDLAVPILGTPRMTSYDLHVKQIMIESIETDPDYAGGKYTNEPALKLANLFGALVVTSPAYRNRATPRDTVPQFIQQTEAPQSIDANDRLWQLRAITRQDVIGSHTLQEVAKAAKAHFLIIVSAEDHLVNPQPALDWAVAIGAPTYVSYGACAHLIMTCDAAAVSIRVREFLISSKLAQ
jgi:homoserine O-acetyltransferase